MSEVDKQKTKETISLPTGRTPAVTKNPKRLVIYGLPKIGKTTLLSQLDNCLIIDLEEGSDHLEALKIKVNSIKELIDLGEQIKKKGKPYKYIAIDTITFLESWCEDQAKIMYMNTPMGKNFKGDSVLSLASGGGYLYLRLAYTKMINYISTLAENVILVGHMKDKMVEKEGKELNIKDLDLTGKLRSITAASSDAIGYIYRENDETRINFKSNDEVICGSRCEHLKGQDMVFDWSKIYID